jgi:hypothetical protein
LDKLTSDRLVPQAAQRADPGAGEGSARRAARASR